MTPPNWWKLYHDAASGLVPVLPHELGRMTIPQLLALTHARPPDEPGPITSMTEYLAREAAKQAQAEAW